MPQNKHGMRVSPLDCTLNGFTICKKYRHPYLTPRQTQLFFTTIISIVFNLLNQSSKNVIFGTIIAFAITHICRDIMKH